MMLMSDSEPEEEVKCGDSKLSAYEQLEVLYKERYWEVMGYPGLEYLKFNTLKFERKHIFILHPYDDEAYESGIKIKVLFEGETFQGEPHGLGTISYNPGRLGRRGLEDPSFKGVCNFRNGLLDNGPAYFILKNGRVLSFSLFRQGAPDGSMNYYDLNSRDHVISKNFLTDTKGWAFEIRRHNETRKRFICDGRVFVGTYRNNLMERGTMSELIRDQNNKRLRYRVTFDTTNPGMKLMPEDQKEPIER